jgi:AAA15 family ATPase/GTPase
MTQIKNIEIKNFKSIRHQKIEDCRRINVFVGYPNTGKSNILEAIGLYSVIRDLGESFQFNDICRVKGFSELFFNKDYKNAVNLLINESFLLEGILEQSGNLGIRVHKGSEAKPEDQFFNSTVSVPQYEFRSTGPTFESEFKASIGRIKKYRFTEDVKIDRQQPLALAIPFGTNLLGVLQGDSGLRKEVVSLLDNYNQKLVLDEKEIIFLKYLTDESGVIIPYHLVADTLKRLIFHKAAIFSNSKNVLLFEEPEAHMFPPFISKFTTDMIFDKRGNQFFVTTHSPFVINDLLENLKDDEVSIYVVGYDREIGETFLRRLSSEQVQEIYQFGIDIYLNLERFLGHEQ